MSIQPIYGKIGMAYYCSTNVFYIYIYIWYMIYIYIWYIYIYICDIYIYILLNYADAFSPAPTSSQIPSKSTHSLGLFQHGYRNVGLVARFHHLFHQRPRTPGCLKAQKSTSGDFHVVGEIQSSSILMGFFPKKPSMLGVSPYGNPQVFFLGEVPEKIHERFSSSGGFSHEKQPTSHHRQTTITGYPLNCLLQAISLI